MTTGVRRSEATGSVALKARKHSLLLLFTQASGEPELRLRYAGPGFDKRPLPEGRLFRGTALVALPKHGLVTTLNVPADPADLPPLLSQTGVFRSLAGPDPNRGIIPYEANSPLWSDGAEQAALGRVAGRCAHRLRGDRRMDVSGGCSLR